MKPFEILEWGLEREQDMYLTHSLPKNKALCRTLIGMQYGPRPVFSVNNDFRRWSFYILMSWTLAVDDSIFVEAIGDTLGRVVGPQSSPKLTFCTEC